MNSDQIYGLIFITVGTLSLIFRNKIISFQGPSKKGSYTLKTRKNRILVGAIGIIILGLMMLFNVRDLLKK